MSTAKNKFYNQDRGFGFFCEPTTAISSSSIFLRGKAIKKTPRRAPQSSKRAMLATVGPAPSTCGRLTGPLLRCSGIGEAGELKAISRVVCMTGRLHAPCLTSIYPT
jgi:hypothetical protein